jgi:hypothetical protein
MPNRDNNDPQRKRKPDEHSPESRPTQDRPQTPKFDIPQQGPDHLPAAPNNNDRQQRPQDPERSRAPELDRASGDETRRAVSGSGAAIPGDYRDILNRLDRIDQPNDISDEEARRLAGLDHEQGDPDHVRPDNLPAITRHEVANISQAIQAAGTVYPKWHGIKNLPGFQHRQIRGMGQDLFSMFTTTPHHDILTISTMANSEREVKAVLGWLQQNAESLPELDIDYTGYGMGEYKPQVREFRTENTRFHVVHDRAGWYIYAYPEQTAVEHGGSNDRLGHDSQEEESDRDEFGALIPKRLKEGKEMKFSSISEQIRYLTNKLDNLEETALVDDIFKEQLAEAMLDESTLAKLLGQTPGARQVVHALHSRHKLASGGLRNRPGHANIDPDYEEIPADTKNIAVTIKSNKDNFCIIVGTHGVAGVKPEEKRWDQSRSKERDTTLPYVVVWSTGDGAESEIAKYRMGRMDATGGSSAMEGGAPNLFNVLRDRIGPVVRAYRATGAVERTKMKGRDELKKQSVPDVEQIGDKIKPVLQKLLQQTVGQLGPRIQRLAQGGNYDAVEKLTRAGKKLQAMITAMDSPNPQWTGWNTPLATYGRVIGDGIQELTQGMDAEGKAQFMRNAAAGQAQELGQLLNYIRSKLFTISE